MADGSRGAKGTVDHIGDYNRSQFDAPDVVEGYVALQGLTPCEGRLFDRHVPAGSRVLDLGVGAGRTTPWLVARADRYVGIDYAPGMVAAARREHPGVDLREGDAADLSAFDDHSFDVVVFSYNGIDYLSDHDRACCHDEVRRVLAPGGTFVFSTHNPTQVLISGAKARGGWTKRLAATGYMTARHLRHRLPQRALWTGEGWVVDHVRSPLRTHMATPRHVERELAAHRFTLVERDNSDRPARPHALRTPWWYYAART